MAEKRTADVKWTGDLASGSGLVSTRTSEVLKEVSVSWPSRSGAAEGKTSPEELIAGAHAACYAMAFSGRLAKNGTPGTSLDVSCTVTFANVDGGWKIANSDITLTGKVDGIDDAKFQEIADDAKANCPVSAALKGNVEISLNATLAS
jgi:osmotically inducible protein OsmC